MSQLTWDDVLSRDDLVGGDIQSVEDGVSYRGPLAEVVRKGNSIQFNSPWTARLNQETGKWERWHITGMGINTDNSQPHDIGDGRINFPMFMLGACTIFPKGGSKLDPAKVEGLTPEEMEM